MQMEQPSSISAKRSSIGIARALFLLGVGVMPILVVPVVGFPFLVAKIAWFALFAVLAFGGIALASLRALSFHIPSSTLAKTVFLLLCAYAFSTVLSQDWQLSLAGSGAEVDSLLFMVIATLAFLLSAVLFKTRESVTTLLTTIVSTTAIVGFF